LESRARGYAFYRHRHTFDELVAAAEAGQQLPRFALPMKIKAKTVVKKGKVESQNLAAIFPGSDSKLKDEYVVMSAHIDHLGVGTPFSGDSIYNGAMDDARVWPRYWSGGPP